MRVSILFFLLSICLSGNIAARDAVVKRVTGDVIVVSPAKKQLHTLGWPNDIINSIAIKTKDGIVLIDTQNSPANAELIKSTVNKQFNDTIFAYIINTHGHSCHSGGNCVFNDYSIIAHTNSITEIKNYDDLFIGQTVDFLRSEIYHQSNIRDTITTAGNLSDSISAAIDLYKFYENDLLTNYSVRYPDITFDDTLTISPGGKTIKLAYMGKGHGNADIVVYIKEDKTLCTGNLFHLGSYEEENMPSFYHNRVNDIDHWISTLEEVLKPQNQIEYVLSTHGKHAFSKDNMLFILDYCKEVKQKVNEAKRNNIPKEQLQSIDHFKSVFQKYNNLLSMTDKVKEMHAKNINNIWKYID